MSTPTRRALLDNALKRQKELIRELEALTKFIEEYEKLDEDRESGDSTDEEHPQLFRAPSQRLEHAERLAEMIDAARRIIIAEKRPMQRGELRKRIEGLGFKVTGQDKNKVFGTNLWRSQKFQMIRGKGYWPMDMELPPEFRK